MIELPTRISADNLGAFTDLLHPDVRWGGEEDTEDTCHSRADVEQWLGRLLGTGVVLRLHEVREIGEHLLLDVRVEGLPDVLQRWERAHVRDGLIDDLRPVDDPEEISPAASEG